VHGLRWTPQGMMADQHIPQPCAVVLGGYVNGYAVIRELHDLGVANVWLLDYGQSLSRWSNKLTGCTRIKTSAASLKAALLVLHQKFERLVIYPTDDLQLELLAEIHDDVASFCFLPFNSSNLLRCLDKTVQYEYCEQLGVPYPKTRSLSYEQDFAGISALAFPLIIKPIKRDDLTSSVFRSLYVEAPSDLIACREMLLEHMARGIGFLVSELVPGDDTQIYAYTAYRSSHGDILNEWVGKKLTQFPDRFGVFSSASNEAPEAVKVQGRALLNGMDLTGIAEPEFKFDARNGEYKLMEINLRSMMWHRVGNLSGVNLQYSQWLDAVGLPVPWHAQSMSPRIHYVYMKHELINLLSRRGYWAHFRHNVFGGDKIHFAVFDRGDLKPFIYDLLQFPRSLLARWLKLFSNR
jgi:predicted ATP-grasp superfamily ATP-dependent carboligase